MSRELCETVGDIKRMPDGTEYRGIIERWADDQGPDEDEGGWPILRLYYSPYKGWIAEAYNDQARLYVDAFNRNPEGGHVTERFERYLRIFLGVTKTHEYGPNQGTDYTYFAFDPAEWRDKVGVSAAQTALEEPLAEVIAWIEGDTWCSWIETRYNPDEALADDEGWVGDEEEGIATYGLYGRKYAEQQITDQLGYAVENHTPVYRYPESEKLEQHHDDIKVIEDFFDSLGDKTRLGRWVDSSYFMELTASEHKQLIYKHFNIDTDKIKEERRLMVRRSREKHDKSA